MGFFDFFSWTKEPVCYNIEGFLDCAHFAAAMDAAGKISDENVRVETSAFLRSQWAGRVAQIHKSVPGSEKQTTSPIVYSGCAPHEYKLVGGYAEFAEVAKRHAQQPQTGSKQSFASKLPARLS